MELDKLTNEELLDVYNDNHEFVGYLEDLLEKAEKEMEDDE